MTNVLKEVFMPNEFVVVQSDDAEVFPVGNAKMLGPRDVTGGSYIVVDGIVPPGLITPAHTHEVEDQSVVVLDGTLVAWVDGVEQAVRAGGFAFRPAGKPHALWNPTDKPARMLEITTPGFRFEEYIRRLNDLHAAGDASAEVVGALASEYGVRFLMEITAELAQRSGTSPAGGFWK
jgi:quercetin dioxygenase-like cupin family protein